jgi:Amt family ammonium transporter
MDAINGADTAWVLISAALVMLMTPALGLFYGGMVRGKNVLSTIMHSFFILALISVQWVLWGYSLAFGPDKGGLIGGLEWVGLNGVGLEPNADYAATIPHQAFMIFQMTFAVITPALISGAFAERKRFKAFVVFTLLWATLVYAPVAHWVWGVGGWIRNLGALDFAGGTVVHIISGVSALVCALVLGKRVGS